MSSISISSTSLDPRPFQISVSAPNGLLIDIPSVNTLRLPSDLNMQHDELQRFSLITISRNKKTQLRQNKEETY